MGITKDLNDSLDFTDNSLRVLNNFPRLLRLRSILLSNNRISHLDSSLPSSIPNLHTIVLTNNQISHLSELSVLSGFSKLTFVTILNNPVTQHENYRNWIIWRNPGIRVLDFERVKDAERLQANKLFGEHESPSQLALDIIGSNSASSVIHSDSKTAGISVQKLTDDDKHRLRQSLKEATSLAEIERIQKALNNGYF